MFNQTEACMTKNKLQWDTLFAWIAIIVFCGVFWWQVVGSIIHIIQKHK